LKATRRNRPPTILDVAREADVGVMSVSRVINDNPSVKAETRARVIKAIAKIGYAPNDAARMLKGEADGQSAWSCPISRITLPVASMQFRKLPSSITIKLSWLRRGEALLWRTGSLNLSEIITSPDC